MLFLLTNNYLVIAFIERLSFMKIVPLKENEFYGESEFQDMFIRWTNEKCNDDVQFVGIPRWLHERKPNENIKDEQKFIKCKEIGAVWDKYKFSPDVIWKKDKIHTLFELKKSRACKGEELAFIEVLHNAFRYKELNQNIDLNP